MITLELPEAIPSRNEVDKMHWAERNRLRGSWQWFVKAAILNKRLRVQRTDPGILSIERISPRKLDRDNFVGGCKQLQDALVREGFFVDDTEAHLTTTYIQTCGRPPRTIVRIGALS